MPANSALCTGRRKSGPYGILYNMLFFDLKDEIWVLVRVVKVVVSRKKSA